MGQKVHPYGFRLGYTKPWRSRWFVERDYNKLLLEDVKLKDELRDKLKSAGVSSVEIERPGNKLRIIIRTARPGIIIGRKGAEIDKLKQELQKRTSREVFIDIQEVHKPELDAQLVSTKDEWRLLTNMHSAFFPQAEAAFRRNFSPGGEGGGGGRAGRGGAAAAAPATPGTAAASGMSPLDETIDFLSKNYGLHTPEWAAWRARMRTPRIAGRWLVSAHIPGRGNYVGEMVISPGAADDEFTTQVKLQSVKGGPPLVHTGTGLVYAGYSWRGRSKPGPTAANAAPDDLSRQMREVMWISPDQLSAEGRWFWGEYNEFGVDVKMERASDGPMLISTNRTAFKTGSQATPIRVFGDHLPADIAPADLDFGVGITVKRISSHTASELVAELDIAADAVPGKRDVAFRRSVLPAAIAVYDRVDYIKVVPQSTLARLGSQTHPKGYQQFEAIAYQRGADGKNYTADDVELGEIDVTWKVEEFYAVYGDDDKDFVGSLNDSGFFTPASDGPNPKRKFSRNNYGDIWIVATAKDAKDKEGMPLVGRSYLVVSVPTYIRWDQPEVAQ